MFVKLRGHRVYVTEKVPSGQEVFLNYLLLLAAFTRHTTRCVYVPSFSEKYTLAIPLSQASFKFPAAAPIEKTSESQSLKLNQIVST